LIDARGNNLVFLLCVPRSGSSLSTAMLQNHSEVFATQEMWFLMSLRDLRLNGGRPYGGRNILNQFFNGVLTDELFESACRSFALEVYNGLLRTGSARMVVDKSPRYYYMLEFLDRLFPESKRIFLIRNPLSVAASYKKVYPNPRDRFSLKDGLFHPDFNMKMTDLTAGLFRYADYFAEPNAHAFRLRYEELVRQPAERLAALCGFLGISYESGMERYGSQGDASKADLFYSMGVGDPLLSEHAAPHEASVGQWRSVLGRSEIELLCRALGADLFRRLGYEEELEEAQRLTGVRFEDEPDREWLDLRSGQLQEASGIRWTPGYRMRTGAEHIPGQAAVAAAQAVPGDSAQAQPSASAHVLPGGSAQAQYGASGGDTDFKVMEAELLRLRVTQNALEKRLARYADEKNRLQARLDSLNGKLDRLKSAIPFGRRLSRIASKLAAAGIPRKQPE